MTFKSQQNYLSAVENRKALVISLIGPFTTLAVSPSTNYDPINLIKCLIVTSFSFYLLSLSDSIKKISSKSPKEKLVLSFIGFFIFWLTFILIFNDAPFSQQFWGTFGRNSGYLTYLSLTFLLISIITCRTTNLSKKVFTTLHAIGLLNQASTL